MGSSDVCRAVGISAGRKHGLAAATHGLQRCFRGCKGACVATRKADCSLLLPCYVHRRYMECKQACQAFTCSCPALHVSSCFIPPPPSPHPPLLTLPPVFSTLLPAPLPQYSAGGGVVVQVSGIMQRPSSPKRPFVQTFFLAVQEKGYYVLNDIFRCAVFSNWFIDVGRWLVQVAEGGWRWERIPGSEGLGGQHAYFSDTKNEQ